MMKAWSITVTALLVSLAAPAKANVVVQGRVMETQGHEVPSCRMVRIKVAETGADLWLRIPETSKDDGILAVTMTALTANLRVKVAYDPVLTSGCGTEPKILYVSLLAPDA